MTQSIVRPRVGKRVEEAVGYTDEDLHIFSIYSVSPEKLSHTYR